MVHRLALFLGGLGATAVLALSLGLGGLFAAAPAAADAGAAPDGGSQAAAPDTTRTIIDKVYVAAAPKPAVVHVNKPPRNKGSVGTTDRPRDRERERGEADENGEGHDRGERGDD